MAMVMRSMIDLSLIAPVIVAELGAEYNNLGS